MNRSRVYSLDVLRLLFAYQITMGHFGISLPPTPEVSVDFFFILSGFFLARKFYAKTFQKGEAGYSAWDYTIDHARTFYPYFLFTLGVAFLYELTRCAVYLVKEPSLNSLWEMGALCFDQVTDLLLVHSSHCWELGLLPPSWQISATLISGYFIYELMNQNEKLTRRIILPASVLMLRSAMVAGVGYFDNYGFFYIPLLRAFAAMGLGVLTWYFLNTKYVQAIYQHKLAMNICSVLAIAGLLLYRDRGRVFLIILPFLVLVCNEPTSWINKLLNHKCFSFCGKLSLAVYLTHQIIMRFVANILMPRLDVSYMTLGLIYAVIVTIISIATVYFMEWVLARRKAKSY